MTCFPPDRMGKKGRQMTLATGNQTVMCDHQLHSGFASRSLGCSFACPFQESALAARGHRLSQRRQMSMAASNRLLAKTTLISANTPEVCRTWSCNPEVSRIGTGHTWVNCRSIPGEARTITSIQESVTRTATTFGRRGRMGKKGLRMTLATGNDQP